jgi:sugar-specific transcriptional regulator TrmB
MSAPFKKRRIDDGDDGGRTKSKSKLNYNKHSNKHNSTNDSVKVTATLRGHNKNDAAASTRSACFPSNEKVLPSSSSSYVNVAHAQPHNHYGDDDKGRIINNNNDIPNSSVANTTASVKNYAVDYNHNHPYMSLYSMSMPTKDDDEIVVKTKTSIQEEKLAIDYYHTNNNEDGMKKKKKRRSNGSVYLEVFRRQVVGPETQVGNGKSSININTYNDNDKEEVYNNEKKDNLQAETMIDDFYYDYNTNDIVLMKRKKNYCRSDEGCKSGTVCDDDEEEEHIIESALAATTSISSSPAIPLHQETNDNDEDGMKKKKSRTNGFHRNLQVSNGNISSINTGNDNDKEEVHNNEKKDHLQAEMMIDDFYYDNETNDIVLVKRNKTYCRSDEGCCKCDVICNDEEEEQIIESALVATTTSISSSPAILHTAPRNKHDK